MQHYGLIGDGQINVYVRGTKKVSRFMDISETVDVMKKLRFVRERFKVHSVEPGAFPLNAVETYFDPFNPTKDGNNFALAAYRCTECRTLFVVPRVEDLHHKCTERTEQSE